MNDTLTETPIEKTFAPSTAPGRRARPRKAMLGVALCVALLSVLFTPAAANAATRTTISGNAVPSTCNGDRGLGAIELSGDLDGCLIFFPLDYSCDELNGFALYKERGRELFVGKYNGERGRFRTVYTLEATYSAGSCAGIDAAVETGSEFPFGAQLTGGCDHFVRGKRGAFKNMRGLITFHDVIPNPGTSGASNFFYSGYLAG